MTAALEVVSQIIWSMFHSPSVFICTTVRSHTLPVPLSFLFRLERSLALAIRNLMLTLAVLTYWADVRWANVLDPAQKLQPTCGSLQQARKAPVQGQTILPLYYCSKQEGMCLCRSPEDMRREAKGTGCGDGGGINSYWKGAVFSFLIKMDFYFNNI